MSCMPHLLKRQVKSGYIDPDGEPNPSPINPTTVVKSDDDDEEETDNGPDPIETAERFAELEEHLVVALLAVEKHGRESKLIVLKAKAKKLMLNLPE